MTTNQDAIKPDELATRYESAHTGAFADAEFVATYFSDLPAPDAKNLTERDLYAIELLQMAVAAARRVVERYVK